MLADFPIDSAHCGTLSKELHRPMAFLHEMLDFIANELPRWRDDPERPVATSETALTEHLCDFLSGAARRSQGWDILQFRNESIDEKKKSRKIDLAPKPCGATIWIDGRRHTQYDKLLPIECKRLPTPKEKDRDEREYVYSQYSSTGGIQRFKAGHHGAQHSLGAMIGYVQQDTATAWGDRVRAWIAGLIESGETGWSDSDLLLAVQDDMERRIAVFRSSHDRANGLSKIELRHLWIQMN